MCAGLKKNGKLKKGYFYPHKRRGSKCPVKARK